MTNADMPSAIQGGKKRSPVRKFSFLILRTVLLPVKKDRTHTQEIPCEITVASAAPFTPMPSPKIKIGSSTILQMAPINTVFMLTRAKPCAVMKAFMPRVSCTKIVPSA